VGSINLKTEVLYG